MKVTSNLYMKNLIYYPTFEPSSMNWIKYALLYLDQFSPIIPLPGRSQLSDVFKQISSETNIIQPFQPTWEDGNDASIKVMNEMDKILSHPERYRDIFNRANIARVFMNQKQWNFKLYQDKYSMEFVHFCKDNKLGKEVDGGMLLSEDLANFFMVHLADVIAYKTKATPITDLKHLDRMVSHYRMNNVPQTELIDTAQATIKLKLPAKIETIGLDKIIQFRNRPDYSELRQAFTNTLQVYLENLEQMTHDMNGYVNSLNKTNSELAKEMLLFFGGVVGVSLGATIVVQGNTSNALEIAQQAVEGTLSLTGGGYAIHQSWLAGKEKRNPRKYLAMISRLKSGE
jgi:hypothetical protein